MNRAVTSAAVLVCATLVLAGCGDLAQLTIRQGTGPYPILPPPVPAVIPTVNVAKVVGWRRGGQPASLPGTRVNAFATELAHPRWMYVLPNGDVLVAESNKPARQGDGVKDWAASLVMTQAGAGTVSADRITLLRDADGDGIAETRTEFLDKLHSPFGMVLVGDDLYVANADALWRYPYRSGQLSIDRPGTKMLDLPAGRNHHWTKNVVASPDGSKLYVTIGSNSNVAEHGIEEEIGRAAIWEVDRATGHAHEYAGGLRNPNGLDWEPITGKLWAAVNERDEIGSDLVPDYITSVQPGGFYGWPYSYFGQNLDRRVEQTRPDLVRRAIVPDYAVGPHTASLGITFARGEPLTAQLREGLYVAQHGSWNRVPKSGYKVIFVPFRGGKPDGEPIDVLTGFLDGQEQAQGRPVGVVEDRRGALLVSDDVGNTIWRVSPAR